MLQGNPDDVLLVVFKDETVLNPAKSAAAGRPIEDDREVCYIRLPGSQDIKPFPADAKSTQWIVDPITGEQRQITYAERFPRQYAQFKAKAQQTRTGTPLANVSWITNGKRLELQSLAIYTVEALAHIDGQELKNLGPGGRDLKTKAEQYLENARNGIAERQAMQENELLKARLQAAEADIERLRVLGPQRAVVDEQFLEMTPEQLRDFIEAQTGHPTHGSLPREVLERMAMAVRSQAVLD